MHHPHALFAVFLDMLFRTRIDQIDLQIGEVFRFEGRQEGIARRGSVGSTVRQVPEVDVVGAEVDECLQG